MTVKMFTGAEHPGTENISPRFSKLRYEDNMNNVALQPSVSLQEFRLCGLPLGLLIITTIYTSFHNLCTRIL